MADMHAYRSAIPKGKHVADWRKTSNVHQKYELCVRSKLLARRAGFSLLEVILALAILGGAIAVLGEGARLTLRNAELARDMALAQLLCESKMSEIVARTVAAENVQRATLVKNTDSGESDWLYSIETASLAEDGLMSVRVTVTRDLPAEKHPVQFSLVRWMSTTDASQSTSTNPSTQQDSGASGSTGAGGTQ
jgi:general secretion pathway protein I